MDFVKISGEVTDITIPEGECIKIEEAPTGRILWEKSLNFTPEWKIYDIQDFAVNGVTGLSTIYKHSGGSGISSLILTMRHRLEGFNFSSDETTSTPAIVVYKNGEHAIDLMKGSEPRAGRYLAIADSGGNHGVAVIQTKTALYALSYPYYVALNDLHDDVHLRNPGYVLGINVPVDETKVKIIYAPEREEYLVTGITGGAFTVPKDATSSTTITYSGKNAINSIWVPELEKYFASTNMTSASRVLSSEDGSNWQEFRFSITKMKGILNFCWLGHLKKLCAVSDGTAKMAISSDGETWELKDVPFSNALCCAYSPEQKLFCVLDKSCAYITRDLTKWIEAPLPDKKIMNFKEVIHVVDGIFACYEYLSDKLCILTTKYPIR